MCLRAGKSQDLPCVVSTVWPTTETAVLYVLFLLLSFTATHSSQGLVQDGDTLSLIPHHTGAFMCVCWSHFGVILKKSESVGLRQ